MAAAENKERDAVAKFEGLRAELETRTNQVSAMEKRAGDGALNFERVKAAYEEVCGERAQLRAALEAASDVVRRQKDLVRRQAGQVVSTKRDAATTKMEVEAAMVAREKEAQSREDALRENLRVAVLREEAALSRAVAVGKAAQEEATHASDKALAELRRTHAVAIEQAVATTTANVGRQCGKEIAELKRLLAQARERIVESNSVRETVQSAEKIKAAMLEDKEDTIRSLKERLAEAEKRLLKTDGYRDRRDQLKRDLRDAEDREAEMGEKLIDAEDKLRAANESFDSIRGHLEAIIDEQVRVSFDSNMGFFGHVVDSSLNIDLSLSPPPPPLPFLFFLFFSFTNRPKNCGSMPALPPTKAGSYVPSYRKRMP